MPRKPDYPKTTLIDIPKIQYTDLTPVIPVLSNSGSHTAQTTTVNTAVPLPVIAVPVVQGYCRPSERTCTVIGIQLIKLYARQVQLYSCTKVVLAVSEGFAVGIS